jgi:2-dehydro-3-deoxyphosphooctonate aldolase (KDO 8-P synthase)
LLKDQFEHPANSEEKTMAYEVDLGQFKIGAGHRPFLIAGPCVIESEQLVMDTAGRIAEITKALGMPYVFKSSFDKANRTSISSFRGPGLEKGLAILAKIKQQIGVPILTDVHTEDQATEAGQVVDMLQIPAFLCRQTDLLIAAAKTGKVVNIKKGQFLSPPTTSCRRVSKASCPTPARSNRCSHNSAAASKPPWVSAAVARWNG